MHDQLDAESLQAEQLTNRKANPTYVEKMIHIKHYSADFAEERVLREGTDAEGMPLSKLDTLKRIVELPYIVCLERSSDPEGVVIHEIGHIFDMTIALLGEGVYEDSYYEVSDSEEWQAIYNLYKDQLAGIDNSTKWNMYNSAEGFAECFRLTYQNPEALIAVCPAAYEFVVDVVAKYAP